VWEVISAIRSARSAEPDLAAGELTALVAENTGVDPAAIRVAVGYYGAYPDEIDAQVVAAEDAEKAIELVLERTRRLLGA
jgi:phenylpyruvate tautomerase PptA (4-oxalocrotonate tautomerase family)